MFKKASICKAMSHDILTYTILACLILICLLLVACGISPADKKLNQELIEAAENEPIYADADWDLKDYIEYELPANYSLNTDSVTGEGEIVSENGSGGTVAFMGIDEYKGNYNIPLTDCVKHMKHTIKGTGKNDSQVWVSDEDVEKWLSECEKKESGEITIYKGENNALLVQDGTVVHIELNGSEFVPYFDEFCESIRFIDPKKS